MEFHEVANIFPLMQGREFEELKDDVKKFGLREPIWTYQGKIIDGRNRFRACQETNTEPQFREWDEEGDLVSFVVSLNLHRRHLDESQRAVVAARIATLPKGANQHAQICAPSQSDAAELLSVSRRTVQSAREVLDQGDPELVSAVERGEVSVSAAADVAELPKEKQREIVARGEKEILQAAKEIRAKKAETRRAERIDRIVAISKQNAPLKAKCRYPVLYCDPPWRYEHIETESRAIENQYPTLSLDEICALPVREVTTDDCILFLWTTSPKLEEAMRVLSAWRFNYRTCAVWDKEKIGMGYYFRQQHELLLVATRGDLPTPGPSDRPPSIIRVRRGEHSAKPVEVYEIIEAMYPELPKLEMFARAQRDGWDSWGNQSEAA